LCPKKRTQLKNRVLRGIFVPRRGEETGGERKFNNMEFHSLYTSPNLWFFYDDILEDKWNM
jgi:hypothetical protein